MQVSRGSAGRVGPEAANRGRGIGKPEKHTKPSARVPSPFLLLNQEHQFNRLDSRMKARLGCTFTRRYAWLPYAHHDF
jgi:hypothetical protein